MAYKENNVRTCNFNDVLFIVSQESVVDEIWKPARAVPIKRKGIAEIFEMPEIHLKRDPVEAMDLISFLPDPQI
jgi:hypothetical protein